MTISKMMWVCSVVFCAFIASCGCTDHVDFIDEGKRLDVVESGKTENPNSFDKAAGTLRLVQYNVGVFSKQMANSTAMIAAMMDELKADVISVNETDSCNTRHNAYQVKLFAEALGKQWKFRYGSTMKYRGGSYGNGVVTKDDITDSYNIALPYIEGVTEPRAAIVVETAGYVFVSTHLDHTNTETCLEEASRLSEALVERYGDSDKPVFVAGDFNSVPSSSILARFKENFTILSTTLNTSNAINPSKCIDYIIKLNNKASVTVKKTDVPLIFKTGDVKTASDHLPVYVDVIIKK